MTRARMRPFVTKEIRALLPAWLASLCAIGAAMLIGPRGHVIGVLAYGFGSVTLGAQSIGHEYTHRTLTMLLSQPSSRRRLLLMKLCVLTVMLLTLSTATRIMLTPTELQWVFASMLCGLFLAPLLTMLCRNPLAGVVFTGATPFWMSALGEVVSARVMWGGMLGVSAVAAVASWRLFMRLEAIDGRGPEMRLPQMFRRGTRAIGVASADRSRSGHPVWLLVKKELHLQQMTFAVAGVSGLFWIAEFAFTKMVPGFVGIPVHVVSILSGALLALLIGSLAGAEERQIGTLEWQVLLPMAMWKQWAVKVGTMLGLAALLSFAVPVVLAAGHVSINAGFAGAIALLTVGSLYVSSLCRTTLRALVVSGTLVVSLALLASRAAVAWSFTPLAALVALVPWLALVMWFAFENHRSAEQGAGRVSRQVMWIAGCLALAVAVVAAFP